MLQHIRSNHTIAAAAIVGATLITCCLILGNSVIRIKGSREVIKVTGAAHKAIHSDFIIWKSEVTEREATQPAAYNQLKAATDRVQKYLISRGIPAAEIFPLAINTRRVPKDTYQKPKTEPVMVYEFSEGIEVRSKSVDLVDRVARESTEMLSQGIPIESEEPQYIYSQLGNLKLTMLAEAAKDAYDRADRIARSTGCRVGQLRYAKMGVIQIEGLYDSEGVTDTGANDTASLDKKSTAIVSAEFSIR